MSSPLNPMARHSLATNHINIYRTLKIESHRVRYGDGRAVTHDTTLGKNKPRKRRKSCAMIRANREQEETAN